MLNSAANRTGSEHDVFRGVADPTRRAILLSLIDSERSIASIKATLPITRNAVNKHLRILSDAGLVMSSRVGRETRFRLHPEPLLELRQWLSYFDRYWDEKLSALKRYVEPNDK